MIQREKHPPTVLDLFQVFTNHKTAMLWTFGTVMLVAIAGAFLASKTYESEAKLFVRLGKESVGMDPTARATSENVVMVHESREFEINSVYRLITSHAVLEEVVKEIGAEKLLGVEPEEKKVQTAGLFPWSDCLEPYSLEDEAIQHLAKNLQVLAVKKSNLIDIAYRAKDAKLAHDVVESVINQARDAHIHVNRTDGSLEFFTGQVTKQRGELDRLEAEICQLKNTSGISHLEDERVWRIKHVAELQDSLSRTEASLKAAEAELAAHQSLLKEIPETVTIGATTGMPHSATSAMREQLFEAQVHEADLLSRYTKDHPLAIAVSAQVASLKELLDKEPVEPQIAQGPNEAHQEIQLDTLKGTSSIASMKAQVAALKEQLEPAREKLEEVNQYEARLVPLEREAELVKANYTKYASHLEQARIDQELLTRNMSNLNVLQPATYSITPVSPKRLVNLVMGLIAAMASSVGVGLILEQRQTGLPGRLLRGPQPPLSFERLSPTAGGRFERVDVEKSWDDSHGHGHDNGQHHAVGNGG